MTFKDKKNLLDLIDEFHAFKEGVEVGRQEMIEKTELWLLEKGIMYVICESDITDLIHDWRKAMED